MLCRRRATRILAMMTPAGGQMATAAGHRPTALCRSLDRRSHYRWRRFFCLSSNPGLRGISRRIGMGSRCVGMRSLGGVGRRSRSGIGLSSRSVGLSSRGVGGSSRFVGRRSRSGVGLSSRSIGRRIIPIKLISRQDRVVTSRLKKNNMH